MERKNRKKRGVIRGIFFSVCFVCLVGLVFSFFCPKVPRGRQAMVLHGDPTVLLSWESDRPRFTVFLLPQQLQIEAMNGYGWYGLGPLWKLDTMDHHNGLLYRTSLEESLATPIRWHGDFTHDAATPVSKETIISNIKDQCSFFGLIRQVLAGKTNISVFEIGYVWKKMQLLGADTAMVFDFQNNQISYEEQLPDQTFVLRFDKERYDAIIGNALEDTPLRQEGMRIALYNTTGTPGIGQRVARQIEHIGGFVVFVGNDDKVYEGTCEVVATKDVLSSYTAYFFRSMYGCQFVEKTDVGNARADLMVRLGKGIERRYQP